MSLFLPIAPESETGAAAAGAAPDPVAGLRVLLVEGDPDVRAVAPTFLSRMGCHATVAATGEEAMRLLQEPNAFELLLTALGAGMRGTQLAAEAQRRPADPARLGISAVLS